MGKKDRYIDALCAELEARRDYIQGQDIETIYFGGGTPSQLNAKDFIKVFNKLSSLYNLRLQEMEITLEANPDDLSKDYLNTIKELPFNRISIGIQSFDDNDLRFLNRRHTARSAIEAVKLCREFGFENISIDLMYGLPNQTLEGWNKNVEQAIDLNVQHISAYHLIYEEGTRLYQLLQERKIHPVDEELSLQLFDLLIDRLKDAGFEHYEISNFARPGFMSRHNSSYWNGSHYLGIGAAAHSYNGTSRQWNIDSIDKYCEKADAEVEILDETDRFNDFILTRLRTKRGIDTEELASTFGKDRNVYCLKQAQKYIDNGLLTLLNDQLQLTRKGLFVSDSIMSDLIATKPK